MTDDEKKLIEAADEVVFGSFPMNTLSASVAVAALEKYRKLRIQMEDATEIMHKMKFCHHWED